MVRETRYRRDFIGQRARRTSRIGESAGRPIAHLPSRPGRVLHRRSRRERTSSSMRCMSKRRIGRRQSAIAPPDVRVRYVIIDRPLDENAARRRLAHREGPGGQIRYLFWPSGHRCNERRRKRCHRGRRYERPSDVILHRGLHLLHIVSIGTPTRSVTSDCSPVSGDRG